MAFLPGKLMIDGETGCTFEVPEESEVSNRACSIMQPFCAFPDVFLLLGISVVPAVRLEEVILNHVHAAFTLLPAELRIVRRGT